MACTGHERDVVEYVHPSPAEMNALTDYATQPAHTGQRNSSQDLRLGYLKRLQGLERVGRLKILKLHLLRPEISSGKCVAEACRHLLSRAATYSRQ